MSTAEALRSPAPDGPRRRPTTRDRQRLETRERIFQAALGEFRRVGSVATQIDSIARTAEVARGTFYLHFASKDAVLDELRQRIEARVVDRLQTGLGEPESVRGFLECLVDALFTEPEDPILVREMMAHLVRRPTDPWAENTYFATLTRYFESFQKRGLLRDDRDPSEFTGVFMTSIFGFLTGATTPVRSRRESIRCMIDFFLEGVITRPDAEGAGS